MHPLLFGGITCNDIIQYRRVNTTYNNFNNSDIKLNNASTNFNSTLNGNAIHINNSVSNAENNDRSCNQGAGRSQFHLFG